MAQKNREELSQLEVDILQLRTTESDHASRHLIFLLPQEFRLKGGKPYSGKVEILLKNRWFGLFKYSLKPEYQQRVCRILGYPGASRIWIFKTKEEQLTMTIMSWSGTDELMYRTYGGGATNVAGLTCQKGRLRPNCLYYY